MKSDQKIEFCKGPFETQVGGNHYQNGDLPGPAEWCMKHGLEFGEASAIKYLFRHGDKDGLKDIKKAYQYVEFIAHVKYGVGLREEKKEPVPGGGFADFVEKTIKTIEKNMGIDDLAKPIPPMSFVDHVKSMVQETRQPVGIINPVKSTISSTFASLVEDQKAWSIENFGPFQNTEGLIDHIKKELKEIEEEPTDLEGWIDVIILAMDGAWRAGHSPLEIEQMLKDKQEKNKNRTWPDWQTAEHRKAIEHIKEGEPCGHPGCLSHISHPCEGCGRIGGEGEPHV